MPASKQFRTATLSMLRKMLQDPAYKIERRTRRLEIMNGVKEIRYAFILKGETVWSIRKTDGPGSHPTSIAIDGKSLWGEFLDSEVEALFKDVAKAYKKRNSDTIDIVETKKKKQEVSSLGQEREERIISFLEQRVK